MGGKPIPIVDMTSSGRGVSESHIATPIYILSGADNIGDGGVTPPTPPVFTYTPFSQFNANAITGQLADNALWAEVPGSKANSFSMGAGGVILPFPVIGRGLVYWTPPVALAGNDQWMDVELVGPWNDLSGIIGPCVRVSTTTMTFYGLGVEGDNWELLRSVAGVETVLDSAAITPIAGDVFRLEIEGTTLRAYRNDVIISTVVDANIASGTLGMYSGAIASANAIYIVRGGDLPIGDLAVFEDYIGNNADERHLGDTCFNAAVGDVDDGQVISSSTHFAVHTPHYIEWDMGFVCVPSKFRSWSPNATSSDWTGISVQTKVESGDAWTTVATGLSTAPTGIDGWREVATFSIIQPARYLRIEIIDTAHASGWIQSEEIQFFGTAEP
jgi:hypothetical protein